MITLAEALRDEGVSSRVAAYSDFGDKVRAAGCDFVDLELSTADWWAEQNAQESDWARNPVKTWLAIRSGGKAEVRATVARLAAVVHHGGSGTTHRGVLVGVPSMAVPISFDQPYWGRRLAELGVGASPVPYRKLSPARLTNAIKQMTGNPEIAARAKQLGAVLSTEQGPATAARAILTALSKPSSRP